MKRYLTPIIVIAASAGLAVPAFAAARHVTPPLDDFAPSTGKCDEAEHVDDPECGGEPLTPTTAKSVPDNTTPDNTTPDNTVPDDDDDSSGPGHDDDDDDDNSGPGHDDNDDDDDDNSGPGHDDNDDNSGPGHDDDHGGSNDA